MTFPTVADGFARYHRDIMPPEAGPTQVRETERAFYAGSYWMLLHLLHSISDEVPDDVGVQMLERLKAECERYIKGQMRGRDDDDAPPPVHEQSSYNVRHAEVESVLRELGRDINTKMPDGFGFALLIFSYGKLGLKGEGEHGAMFYLSNAQRETMIAAMREFITRNTQ